MKRSIILITSVLMIAVLAGCMTHTHVVGGGAQTGDTVASRQWYILWGLVPLNDADTSVMSGGSSNYTIVTQVGGVDWLINMFLGSFSIVTRTVTVTK
jgi:hypothetical protein